MLQYSLFLIYMTDGAGGIGGQIADFAGEKAGSLGRGAKNELHQMGKAAVKQINPTPSSSPQEEQKKQEQKARDETQLKKLRVKLHDEILSKDIDSIKQQKAQKGKEEEMLIQEEEDKKQRGQDKMQYDEVVLPGGPHKGMAQGKKSGFNLKKFVNKLAGKAENKTGGKE